MNYIQPAQLAAGPGSGYAPHSSFIDGGGQKLVALLTVISDVHYMFQIAFICNRSFIISFQIKSCSFQCPMCRFKLGLGGELLVAWKLEPTETQDIRY